MANMYGAAWQLTALPPPPIDLHLTDDGGEMLLLRWASLTGATVSCVQVSLAAWQICHAICQGLQHLDIQILIERLTKSVTCVQECYSRIHQSRSGNSE